MRQIHKITITDISIEKRAKAIDIISAALVAQYHRNVMVIQEGHSSESAIDLLPPNVSVFVICGEKAAASVVVEPEAAETLVGDTERKPVEIEGDFVDLSDFTNKSDES